MDINITLIVQMLVFITLEERQEKIADGLAAAERGRRELELAQHRVTTELKQAKAQAHEIIEKANVRAAQLVEEAKEDARQEAQRQMKIAQEQFAQEVNNARAGLRNQLASLAVAGAEKILKREVDQKSNKALLDQLIEEI